MSATSTNMTTTTTTKHDEKYFEDRLSNVRDRLVTNASLPSFTDTEADALRTSCEAFQEANGSYKKAKTLFDHLNKHKDEEQYKNDPNYKQSLEMAQQVMEMAQTTANEALQTCIDVWLLIRKQNKSMSDFFNEDASTKTVTTINADLLEYEILSQPKMTQNLAKWCQQDDNAMDQYILQFLDHDQSLQKAMIVAGGSVDYGRTLSIYQKLNQHAQCTNPNKSPCLPVNDPKEVLERLRLAVAVRFGEPVLLFGYKDKYVDPLLRYVHYEQAFLFGELDPSFEQFSAWELAMAVNSNATDEQLGWGRQSLRNYRPDLCLLPLSEQWRYCRVVRTDVSYKDPVWYKEPHSYDQILSGGGKCGPRAWYGRFSCQAFGIPIWGVKQPGHAAMTRWTTNGWKTVLGAGFQYSYWGERNGLDFLLETQARAHGGNERYYHHVTRMHTVAQLKGEPWTSTDEPDPNRLYRAAAVLQARWLATMKSNCRSMNKAALHSSLSHNKIQKLLEQEQKETKEPLKLMWEHSYKQSNHGFCGITVADDDTPSMPIILPATSCSQPSKPTSKVLFMKSFLGGDQLYVAAEAVVEYTLLLRVKKQGRNNNNNNIHSSLVSLSSSYQLSLRICSAHRTNAPFLLTIHSPSDRRQDIRDDDDDDDAIQIDIPYTMGMWQETKPVTIQLPLGDWNDDSANCGGPARSSNEGGVYTVPTILRFSSQTHGYGVAIKDIKMVATKTV